VDRIPTRLLGQDCVQNNEIELPPNCKAEPLEFTLKIADLNYTRTFFALLNFGIIASTFCQDSLRKKISML
jgi:hypothetical protein